MGENNLECIAYKYLKQKAETGDQEAQYNLALYYKQCLCIPKDLNESLKWMLQSAQKGHIKAQYELAQYHMKFIEQKLIQDSYILLYKQDFGTKIVQRKDLKRLKLN